MMRKLLFICLVIMLLISGLTCSVSAADTDNPRLVLSSYVINDGSTDTVIPGRFTLKYTLQNTSGINVVNTILSYDQRNSAIIPVHGRSNVEYIGDVGSERQYSGAIELNIPDKTATGLYQFDISLSYNIGDSAVHSQLSTSFSIFIGVNNNPELDLKRVELSSELSGTDRRYLYIEYENPRTSDFRDLQLVIEGNIDEQQKTQMLPLLRAGRSNSIEYPIQFTETGIQYIDVYISYADAMGNIYQTPVITEQTNIVDDSVTEVSPSDIPSSEGYISKLFNNLIKNMRNPAFLAMLFLSVIVIAGIVLIVSRIRKQAIKKKWYYKDNGKNNDDEKKKK